MDYPPWTAPVTLAPLPDVIISKERAMPLPLQICAEIFDESLRGGEAPIAETQALIQECLKKRAFGFCFYQRSIVEMDGEVLRGEPKNYSPRSYVGIAQVRIREALLEDLRQSPSYFKREIETVTASQPGTAFMMIPRGQGEGEMIPLKEGETVYDREGRVLWPAPAVPDAKTGAKPPARAPAP